MGFSRQEYRSGLPLPSPNFTFLCYWFNVVINEENVKYSLISSNLGQLAEAKQLTSGGEPAFTEFTTNMLVLWNLCICVYDMYMLIIVVIHQHRQLTTVSNNRMSNIEHKTSMFKITEKYFFIKPKVRKKKEAPKCQANMTAHQLEWLYYKRMPKSSFVKMRHN